MGPASSNINVALSDLDRDPVSGSVPLRAVACQISRDATASRGWWEGERVFRIASLRSEAADVVALALEPDDGELLADFLPGQHVTVRSSSVSLARSYSLTGCCTAPTRYEIAVKLIGTGNDGAPVGRMSTHIHGLEPGRLVTLEAPTGTFTPPLTGNRPVILMAAGIGITPFISYLDALARWPARERPPGIHLTYVCRSGAERPFGPRLRTLACAIPELQAVHIFTRPSLEDQIGQNYDRCGRSAVHEDESGFSGRAAAGVYLRHERLYRGCDRDAPRPRPSPLRRLQRALRLERGGAIGSRAPHRQASAQPARFPLVA